MKPQRPNARQLLGIVGLAATLLAAACSRIGAPGGEGSLLRFDPEESLGRVLVRDAGNPELETYATPPEVWTELDQARGRVVVPPGKDVKLEIPYEQKVSLTPIRNLDPDSIHTLQIGGTMITDEHFRPLRGLTGLRNLYIRAPGITDKGMRALRGMTELRSLELWWCNITDEGLKNLSGMNRLKNLVLVGADITDEGIRNLAGMTEIETLWLSETPVGDGAIRHLAAMQSLKCLYIRNTNVGDGAIEAILAHKNLCQIDISWTDISAEGLRRLQSGLHPNAIMNDPLPNPRPEKKKRPRTPGTLVNLRSPHAENQSGL